MTHSLSCTLCKEFMGLALPVLEWLKSASDIPMANKNYFLKNQCRGDAQACNVSKEKPIDESIMYIW